MYSPQNLSSSNNCQNSFFYLTVLLFLYIYILLLLMGFLFCLCCLFSKIACSKRCMFFTFIQKTRRQKYSIFLIKNNKTQGCNSAVEIVHISIEYSVVAPGRRAERCLYDNVVNKRECCFNPARFVVCFAPFSVYFLDVISAATECNISMSRTSFFSHFASVLQCRHRTISSFNTDPVLSSETARGTLTNQPKPQSKSCPDLLQQD